MNPQEAGSVLVGLIAVTQDNDKGRAVVKTVMNLGVP